MPEQNPHICIFGPTASGKSHLAVKLAQRLAPIKAVIINSDSMQLYSSLPILTAQPTVSDKIKIPHYLYAIAAPTVRFSAGIYAEKAEKLLLSIKKSTTQTVTIICGGSGLYLKALLAGLTKLPRDNLEKKKRAVAKIYKWQQQGENLYKLLKQKDPETAKHLNCNDRHRIIRALEFFETHNLALYPTQQKAQKHKVIISPHNAIIKPIIITLDPPRSVLYKKINNRFLNMLKNGALEEAQKLRGDYKNIPHDRPIHKTLGLAEIYQYLDGKILHENMLTQAQQRTRNYAKRQVTWMRHQLQSNLKFEGPLTQSTENICQSIIDSLDKASVIL